MIYSVDQLGRKITLNKYPEKIISLVPSISQLLWDMQLQNEIYGITKFCIHPDEIYRSKTRIGGTKNINVDLIRKINPDLIIGNKEENTKEDIEKLSLEFPVWMSDVNDFDDAIKMIDEIGSLTNRKNEATKIIADILNGRSNYPSKPGVIYFIWHEPDYAAGKNTFIDAMLSEAGFNNCIQITRYPEIKKENTTEYNPDYIFLSSEPYPFSSAHTQHFTDMFPNSKIIYVDGEMFSWYGSGMIKAMDYFKELNAKLNQGR